VTIDAAALCARPEGVRDFEWTEADFRRYAACVGGEGILPTFPSVVAWISTPTFTELGVDPVHALHAAQRIECGAPIGGPRSVRVETRVTSVRDKGVSRGAIVTASQRVTDRGTGETIAILTTTCFGRAEGGSGDAGPEPVPPRAVPLRAPDASFGVPTSVGLAVAYSATGDANPLHVDAAIATAAGFPRPILHGLCVLGIAARIVMDAVPGHPGRNLATLEARFTAPVFPGDMLVVEVWQDAGDAAFQVRIPGREIPAISAGYATFR
jgi:acyl dehydratase